MHVWEDVTRMRLRQISWGDNREDADYVGLAFRITLRAVMLLIVT